MIEDDRSKVPCNWQSHLVSSRLPSKLNIKHAYADIQIPSIASMKGRFHPYTHTNACRAIKCDMCNMRSKKFQKVANGTSHHFHESDKPWEIWWCYVVLGYSSMHCKIAMPWNTWHIQYRSLVLASSGAKPWRNEHRAEPHKLCPASKSSLSGHLHDMLLVGGSARIITKEAWLPCDSFRVSFS